MSHQASTVEIQESAYSVEKLAELSGNWISRKIDLLERFRIDDRETAKGSSTPQNTAEVLCVEFFNRIGQLRSPEMLPQCSHSYENSR